MDGKTVRFLALFLCSLVFSPGVAKAGTVEISGMLALSNSDFSDGYKSETRRYTGSIDFKFTAVSALEVEYTDSTTNQEFPTTLGGRLLKPTTEKISYRDQVYSFNWVQNLVSSKWILQPYVVFGGGRMVRKAQISLPEYSYAEDSTQNVTSGTAGVGLRVFLTKSLALKAEMRTYVPNFEFKKYKENQMTSVGLSWMF